MNFSTIMVVALALAADPAPKVEKEPDFDALYKDLDSDHFIVRQKASEKLEEHAGKLLFKTRAFLKTDPPPEARVRAERLLERGIDAELETLGKFPFIDSLWYDVQKNNFCSDMSYPFIGRIYPLVIHHLDSIGRDALPWSNYRLASRSLAREMIKEGYPTVCIKILFHYMHERDEIFLARYGKGNGGRPPEPEDIPAPIPAPAPQPIR